MKLTIEAENACEIIDLLERLNIEQNRALECAVSPCIIPPEKPYQFNKPYETGVQNCKTETN